MRECVRACVRACVCVCVYLAKVVNQTSPLTGVMWRRVVFSFSALNGKDTSVDQNVAERIHIIVVISSFKCAVLIDV